MSFIRYNRNPQGIEVGDCVIRAISTVLDLDWYIVHDELCDLSRDMADMPSSNRVWKKYLWRQGFQEFPVDNSCPNCLTVSKFCSTHPKGSYILSTCDYSSASNGIIVVGTHVIAIIAGDYYDTWDSGNDVPLSFFTYKNMRR